MPTTNLGRVAIVPQGAYNPATTYKKLDLVTGAGGTYLYVNATPAEYTGPTFILNETTGDLEVVVNA